jgi:hypothetical protein
LHIGLDSDIDAAVAVKEKHLFTYAYITKLFFGASFLGSTVLNSLVKRGARRNDQSRHSMTDCFSNSLYPKTGKMEK